jgi:hypothetical protein
VKAHKPKMFLKLISTKKWHRFSSELAGKIIMDVFSRTNCVC